MPRKKEPTWHTNVLVRKVQDSMFRPLAERIIATNKPVVMNLPDHGKAVRMRLDFHIWRKTESEALGHKEFDGIVCRINDKTLEFTNQAEDWMLAAFKAAGFDIPEGPHLKTAITSRFVPDPDIDKQREAEHAMVREARQAPEERQFIERINTRLSGVPTEAERMAPYEAMLRQTTAPIHREDPESHLCVLCCDPWPCQESSEGLLQKLDE